MMRLLTIILVLWAGLVAAEGPETSIRPEGRVSSSSAPSLRIGAGVTPLERPESVSSLFYAIAPPERGKRPTSRPSGEYFFEAYLRSLEPQGPAFVSSFAVGESLHPLVRPATITQQAREREVARRRGQICGDPAIQGVALGAMPGRGRCGIDSGVRVRSVAGVSLGPNATIDCPTARALKTWVERSAAPAVGNIGGGIESLRVVSHYSCRFRNSASSGRLSEHSFGRAIDIAGIGLKNGDEITVLTDWGRGAKGRALSAMWRGACGPFGTVLGPNSNRFHADHFHFDTARYRSGSYCR